MPIFSMRFRRLAKNELENLEEDFINFLPLNDYADEDLMKKRIRKSTFVVGYFQRYCSRKVYDKINYLQHRTKDTIRVFKCDKETIQ